MSKSTIKTVKKTYFGTQTKQALQNFPFPIPLVSLDLIYAIVRIKQAAALASAKIHVLDEKRAHFIAQACKEILQHKWDDQFVTPAIQGGAGTSINMNVNEVIAARATELAQKNGHALTIHPNDHVNIHQSTNDVNPSALRIVTIQLGERLLDASDHLIKIIHQKAEEYKDVPKLARTHLQDAIPTTIDQELNAYADIIKRNEQRIKETIPYLLQLNMGGTAIGNSLNAPKTYIDHFYNEISEITELPLRRGNNLMSLTSSNADFCHLSAAITIFTTDLSKIASDIRLLSSGPKGGIGEITLATLQPGSSIMPGKVNPVALESVNQIHYYVKGQNVTIHQAAENSQLELAVMFPVIANGLITSLNLLVAGIQVLADSCFATLKYNKERCKELLENSTAYATVLSPILGYDVTSALVKEALATNSSIKSLVLQKNLLSADQLKSIW